MDETTARRYPELIKVGSRLSDKAYDLREGMPHPADAAIASATHIVDAIAYVPPKSDRDAIIQGVLLVHHLRCDGAFDVDREMPSIEHALALSIVRHFAQASGVDLAEICALFKPPPVIEPPPMEASSREALFAA